MRSAGFSRRPKARRIDTASSSEDDSEPKTPVVVRPSKSSTSTKKKTSKLRLSFGVDVHDGSSSGLAGDDDSSEPVFVPKKSALSRKAIERNAAKKGVVGMERLSIAPREEKMYTQDYLAELKSAQVTAPSEEKSAEEWEEDDGMVVDEPVFGEDGAAVILAGDEATHIPDAGMVQIMKEKRRRKAEASKPSSGFVSLNGSESDENQIMLKPKKRAERRLPKRDDYESDEVENYVDESERVLVGSNRRLAREQERRRKQGIRDAIEEAEGSDDSRDSLEQDFEKEQIRAGAFSTTSKEMKQRGFEADLEAIARNPPTVANLPKMEDVLTRLEASLGEAEMRKRQMEKMLENLMAEKVEIQEREQMMQGRLKEVGEEYDRLRKEAGLEGGGPDGVVNRGLESFGSTPIRVESSTA